LSANTEPLDAGVGVRPNAGYLAIAFYGAVLLALLVHLGLYLRYALAAVRFPFGLDYGEGIVWQQALLIPGERMYGDIARYPFIVFHYPPVYHLAVRAVAALGVDWLAAGRGISVLCTLLIAVLVAAISHDIAGPKSGRIAGLIGSAVAGLTVFCYWPVVFWSAMMRVDMLAIMLGFLGLWLAGRSFRSPWLLYLAVLSFVLGLYTKQTSISAPLAVLLVSVVVNRRLTIKAYGLGLAAGLAGLALLNWVTNGGFVRHLVLYNLNRFSPGAAVSLISEEWAQAFFLVLALAGLAIGWKRVIAGTASTIPAAIMLRIGSDPSARLLAILTLNLIFATGMLVTLGKTGASLNYMIEWMCLWSVMIGVLVTHSAGQMFAAGTTIVRSLAAAIISVMLLAQILIIPPAPGYFGADPEQMKQLVARIRDTRRPVLSDDMVILLRAGKEVPWEPAIFAELASTGRWDERLIIDRIAANEFAFIATQKSPGDPLYENRFTPAVDRALRKAYPRTELLGGMILHLPPA
jgi:hypothetical protein